MRLIFSFLLVALFSAVLNAQIVSCPPNIDFEQGNLSQWQFFVGTCCPINATNVTPPLANRHTLTSGAAIDPYGGFPIVSPGGGSYALKLGNDGTGEQAEKARYTFTIPAGVNNYSLIYRYAVVLEDPSHSYSDQPRFEVKVYDSITNQLLPCATYSYVAAAVIPGFFNSPIDNSVRCKDWSTASINLSGYGGQTLIAEFASGDCALGAHFGYGYVDLTCGLFQILNVNCNNSPTSDLNGPPGFAQYLWYDSAYTTLIGTGMNIVINTPPANTQYNLVVVPYVGFGCTDTLHTLLTISNINLTVSNDTALCQYDSVQLGALAIGNCPPFTYTWLPNNNISCTNCANPKVNATTTQNYFVTVTDTYGCSKSDSVLLTVHPLTFDTIDRVICPKDTFLGYYSTGIYKDTFVNAMGCDSIRLLNLYVDEIKFDIDIKDVNCKGEITGALYAQIASSQMQNKYMLVPGNYVNTTGTFTDLAQGIYTLSVKDSFGCKKDTVLDVGLISPPMSLQFDKHNLPCKGTGYEGWAEVLITGGIEPFSYLWYTSPTHTSNKIEHLSFGYYPIFIVDAIGCKINDSVYIEPGNCCEEVFIPNAFTPNNDGLNDVFKVTTSTGIDLLQWAVYNRWGREIFNSENYMAGWDGNYLDTKQPAGTYFYIFRYRCLSDGKLYFKRGDVTLLR